MKLRQRIGAPGSRTHTIREVVDRLRSVVVGVRRFGISYIAAVFQNRDENGAVAIRRKRGRLYLRPRNSDFDVFNQIFIEREYDLSRFKQWARIESAYNTILSAGRVPIIVDAGGNVGLAAIWFATKFPRAHILSVEPDSDNAALARKNGAPFANVRVIEAAIGAHIGRATLSRSRGASWAVTTERSESGDVPIVTMDGLLADAGDAAQLFIAKFDIEGFEKEVFSANLAWMGSVSVLIVEPHDWMLPGKGTSAPLLAAVSGMGFDILVAGENLVFVR